MCRPQEWNLIRERQIFNVPKLEQFTHFSLVHRKIIEKKLSVHHITKILTSKIDRNLRQGSRIQATCKYCE